MLEKEEEKKEKYRSLFNMLPDGLKASCKKWAKLENWTAEDWMVNLEALMGAFEDYREAERYVRGVLRTL